MNFVFAAVFLLLAAYPLVGTVASVWLLVGSQLVLLLGEIHRKQVTGAGAFIFMSFLFFGVRPVYMLLEKDYTLFTRLFQMRVGLNEITDGLWWASAALVCFALGAAIFPRLHIRWLRRRRALNNAESVRPLVSQKVCAALMAFQVMTLPVMFYLARGGRSLYGSAFGAYVYDLPVPLQAVHIITVVVLFEGFLRRKTLGTVMVLSLSVVLFLMFTWLMRDVTLFRGFYVAGVMIAGIAVLQRLQGRVGYAWLILPIVVLQPFFQYLGQTRGAENEQIAEEGMVNSVFEERTLS